jgi:hypothetical protein
LIRDGIAEVVRRCPPEERGLVTNLHYAYLKAEVELERMEKVAEAELFG